MSGMELLVLVLAAGKGTRMRSRSPKVMHKVAGQSMLAHVLDLADRLDASETAVVVGPAHREIEAIVGARSGKNSTYVQAQQLGTADAVLAARKSLEAHNGHVLVLYADTPLLTQATLESVRGTLDNGAHVAVLGFEADDPTGYGRLVRQADGQLIAIREQKDASAEEQKITLCNSGVMGFSSEHLLRLLSQIGNDNANGEFYLTDMVEMAHADGLDTRALICDEREVLGVNDRSQLAEAEGILQSRLRAAAMEGGVTMIAPETVYLSVDTQIGQDVIIEPNVFIAPGVVIENDATIRANSYLENATVGSGATVGPYARLRPGTVLGPGTRVGNFVEVKNATLGDGAKINHLSYVGDSSVGADANIGAGTITCNYDGFSKHRTTIGAGAFIGSNSSLVAPVTIADGAYVGSGSVITKSVGADALAITRAKQEERVGWAAKFRALKSRSKKAS